MVDGFTIVGLIAWLILGSFGFVGKAAFDKATQIPPVMIEGPPCPVTMQSTGRVQFWKRLHGWGMIKSDNGESVYALWHKLAEGQHLHAGEHVMYDVDRSHSSGTPSAVNLTVCGAGT